MITFGVKHGGELVGIGLILLLCAVLLDELLKSGLGSIEPDLTYLDLGNLVSFDKQGSSLTPTRLLSRSELIVGIRVILCKLDARCQGAFFG